LTERVSTKLVKGFLDSLISYVIAALTIPRHKNPISLTQTLEYVFIFLDRE
jgi:hypothetical protein